MARLIGTAAALVVSLGLLVTFVVDDVYATAWPSATFCAPTQQNVSLSVAGFHYRLGSILLLSAQHQAVRIWS